MDFQTVVFALVEDIEEKLTLLGQLVVLVLTTIVMHQVTQTVTLLLAVLHKDFQLHQVIATATHKKYTKVWHLRLARYQHKVLDSVGLNVVAGVYRTEQVDKVQ